MVGTRIPLVQIEPKIENRIRSLGGKPLHIYQALSHHPSLLSAWIEFAYSLRKDCQTSRALRELMILRGAQIVQSDYEWQQHHAMALAAGVSLDQINSLSDWQNSSQFSKEEGLALELMEALMQGRVSQDLFRRVTEVFSLSDFIELVMTGSFYAMVPRVLDALQIPLEESN